MMFSQIIILRYKENKMNRVRDDYQNICLRRGLNRFPLNSQQIQQRRQYTIDARKGFLNNLEKHPFFSKTPKKRFL